MHNDRVRRTQIYLEEDLWKVLHIRARELRTTVSRLVCQAVRERYHGEAMNRKRVMESFAGIRKNQPEIEDSTHYIRGLRRGRPV